MKLEPKDHAWLARADIAQLFAAFPEGALRFVGGCVRNTLLGAPVDDIDLATPLVPDAVEEALAQAGIRSVATGKAHGTLTAVIDGVPFEITSLRKDVETDGRRAVVAFTEDWTEDAQRRDFTLNALYADQAGHVFDPTGQGLEDLKARRLRFIGEAQDRISEDYLRILRYFRFVAYYVAEAPLDNAALTACRDGRKGLKGLSAERVWKEIKKLLSAPDPARAVRVMLQQDILETLLPEASNVDGLEHLVGLEKSENLEPDPLLRLMAMSAREPLPMALLCKRLKMSNAESDRLRGWSDSALPLSPFVSERDQYEAIYKMGKSVASDRAVLRAAGETESEKRSVWLAFVGRIQSWDIPEFPVTGKDLEEAGVLPGPEMGRLLKALEALWIRSGFSAGRPQLLMALSLLNRKEK